MLMSLNQTTDESAQLVSGDIAFDTNGGNTVQCPRGKACLCRPHLQKIIARIPGQNEEELGQQFENAAHMMATDTACYEPADRVIKAIQKTWGEIPVSRVRPKAGMLSYLGYHVGYTRGIPKQRRRIILHYVLMGNLPFVDSRRYVREWGLPKSYKRFCKLRGFLYGEAESARRRRSANMSRSIAEWTEDHDWLVQRYKPIFVYRRASL